MSKRPPAPFWLPHWAFMVILLGIGAVFCLREEQYNHLLYGTWRTPDGKYELYLNKDHKQPGTMTDLDSHTQRQFGWSQQNSYLTLHWFDKTIDYDFSFRIENENILKLTPKEAGAPVVGIPLVFVRVTK